jgi:RNA polymerase-binding transcription factor DksA
MIGPDHFVTGRQEQTRIKPEKNPFMQAAGLGHAAEIQGESQRGEDVNASDETGLTAFLDRESNLLRDVRFALRRMDEKCYGTCLHCEEEINVKRLAAVPWAAYCLKCQDIADRHGFEEVVPE